MSAQDASPHRHRCKRPVPYLILTNISKRQNVRNLLQLAAAYGCPTVFVVGQRAFEFDPDAEGTDVPPVLQEGVRSGKMRIIRFDKLEVCVAHIKSLPCCDDATEGDGCGAENGEAIANDGKEAIAKPTIPILGVEIDPSSVNLEDEPFATSTAFMMGNEGSGMTAKQMSVCDGFLRISQYGGGTASLNVSVAAGLALHRFHHWARGDAVRTYDGNAWQVDKQW
ncbi:hypothetical protein ACHAXT_003628 [Thalassiosira profunda]